MFQNPSANQNIFSSILVLFFCGLLATTAPLTARAGVLAATGGPCFPVFDALLFTNKPDLRAEGLLPSTVVNPDHWLALGQSPGQIPSDPSILKGVHATNSASRILVLDSEDWPAKGAQTVVDSSLNNYLTLFSRVKHVGFQGPIGYYGVPPIREYWDAIG